KIPQILLGEPMEKALHFARQSDQGIPRAVYREVVAAGIDDADLSPELRQGAQDFQLTGEELFVEHGEWNVFFDGMHAPEPQSKIIPVTAEDAPDRSSLRATSERLNRRGRFAVVGRSRMARQHDAVRRKIGCDRPRMLALARKHLARRFRRPA